MDTAVIVTIVPFVLAFAGAMLAALASAALEPVSPLSAIR
jgi:hypothetical protein